MRISIHKEGLTKRTMKSTATMLFATCPGNRQTLHSPVAFGATICPSYNPLKLKQLPYKIRSGRWTEK